MSEEFLPLISSTVNNLTADRKEPAKTSEIKGFEIVPNPQRGAEEWFELFRSGKREEATAQVGEEARRSRQAMDASIDAQLRALAASRG
jgi:hypothetical protein